MIKNITIQAKPMATRGKRPDMQHIVEDMMPTLEVFQGLADKHLKKLSYITNKHGQALIDAAFAEPITTLP